MFRHPQELTSFWPYFVGLRVRERRITLRSYRRVRENGLKFLVLCRFLVWSPLQIPSPQNQRYCAPHVKIYSKAGNGWSGKCVQAMPDKIIRMTGEDASYPEVFTKPVEQTAAIHFWHCDPCFQQSCFDSITTVKRCITRSMSFHNISSLLASGGWWT